jgi:tRNA pseudouridine55 synthase
MKRDKNEVDGILVVDKPSGITSHDAVARVRKILRMRRVGHTGILDPIATGVLPMCLGKATRLAQFLQAEGKAYEGVIRLGFSTDTYDCEGRPTSEAVRPRAPEEDVRRALEGFRGEIEQVPPMFSAKKVGGEKLYELARKGQEVERAPVRVSIEEIEMLSFDGERVGFRLRCSSGTYVRNIAHDLGKMLGCGGHLEALRRTAVGRFTLERAVTLDALSPETLHDHLIEPGKAPLGLPRITLNGEGFLRVRHGQPVDRSVIDRVEGDEAERKQDHAMLVDAEGRLVAIAERKAAMFFQPRTVFV